MQKHADVYDYSRLVMSQCGGRSLDLFRRVLLFRAVVIFLELRARFATGEVVASLAILGMDRPPTQMSSKNNR